MAEKKEKKIPELEGNTEAVFVDRIEGTQAVLLIGERELVVAKKSLPRCCKEGMWLTPDGSAIDKEMMERIKAETAAKRAKLMAADDGDDFAL